ncbi:Bro-N domain-containing protein [Klebsiella variicola]|uniref:BRO-N domain-containing protein n=1 Tax=Klebsiella variicola TaxID=244366 RepID=UPI003A95895E
MGHPEHEVLFVANQVNKAAGLANQNIAHYIAKGVASGIRLRDLGDNLSCNGELREPSGRLMRDTTWLIDEPNTYKVLLRGHSPQSEPFRKWVTEEVLPTIRKTGKYDIAKSNLIIDNMSSTLN